MSPAGHAAQPGAAPPPPQPRHSAMGAAPRFAPAPSGWQFWVILLLISGMFATAALGILNADRTWVLAIQYACWVAAALSISLQLKRWQVIKTDAPPRRALVLFLVLLAISNVLVWNAQIRGDMNSLFAQSAALMFLTLPFFTMAFASKVMDTGQVLLRTCHIMFALCAISVGGEMTGLFHFEGGTYGRYFGFLGDQVAWAVTLPIVVYFCSGRFVLAALAAATLALTASRAPAICLVAALLLLIVMGRGHRARRIVTLAILLIFVAFSGSLFSNLLGRLGETAFSSNDRVATAQLGIRLFYRSPVFGMGYNAQTYFYPLTQRRALLGEWSVQTSTFVQMLSEGGIFVFAAYLAFVVACTAGGLAILKQARETEDWRLVSGAVTWLLAMLWVNQSAAWFLVGSYVGPLVFGMAGIVTGYWARIIYAKRVNGLAAPTR